MLPASIMESISEGYDKLWKEFIKPPRLEYSVEDLGPKVASIYQQVEINDDDCFVRKDFYIMINETSHIAASFFHHVSQQELATASPTSGSVQKYDRPSGVNVKGQSCLIYCHSHNGSRMEGKFLREFCMENHYTLCLFDFLGHGQSEGEYVSCPNLVIPGLFRDLSTRQGHRVFENELWDWASESLGKKYGGCDLYTVCFRQSDAPDSDGTIHLQRLSIALSLLLSRCAKMWPLNTILFPSSQCLLVSES